MKIISRREAKELGLKRYFTDKECKHGHVNERLVSNGDCVTCSGIKRKSNYESNKESIAVRQKIWRQNNQGKIKSDNKKYYIENQDKIKAYRENNKDKIRDRNKSRTQYQRDYYAKNKDKRRLYYLENKERISEYKKSYSKNNKDKINEWRDENWLKLRKSKRDWNKSNPMQVFARSTLQRIEIAIGKNALEKNKHQLGYTQDEFIHHIESQFKDGMSWGNRSEWHIDHIKPVKAFLDEGVTDIKIINALSNLKPLWASENLAKGSKY